MTRTLIGAALALALACPVLHAQGVKIGASYIGAAPAHAAHRGKIKGKIAAAPRVQKKMGSAHHMVLGVTSMPPGNSNPGFVTGQIPTAQQWNGYFSTKFDYAGGMLGGPLGLPASTTSAATFNLSPGATPTTPNDGDIWATTSGLFTQVAGATIGPLGSGGGGGGDVNITEWAGQAVGAPTAPGAAGTGLFPNVNSYILNTVAVTVASLPLPAGAATATGQTTTQNLITTGNGSLASILANQTNNTQKGQQTDTFGNTLGMAAHPTIISCPDGTCAGGSGGGGNVFQGTLFVPNASNPGTANSATTAQQFASSGSLTIYLVNYSAWVDQDQTNNATFQIVAGTGGNCGTSQHPLTPLRKFGPGNGIVFGSIGVLNASAAGDALCVLTTTTTPFSFTISAAQQ